MDMRAFGRTGMHLSVLGFGCGAVGGLMVRGYSLASYGDRRGPTCYTTLCAST
jgi:aryl-alcohol dehydrogenase-like predicted oxidoreductase